MIKYIPFSMFDAFENFDIQVIVNTVNCIGAMGKGLALECKIRYPQMFEEYKERCDRNEMIIGKPYLYKGSKKWVLNFPTKNHWKYFSKKEYIEKGLKYFVDNYKIWKIKSIAFPKLGSTEGKLDWIEVRLLMEKYLNNLDNIKVYVFLDQNPSKKEKKILEFFNSGDEEYLKEQLKFSKKQIEIIRHYIGKNGQLTRIRNLLRIKGVGEKTYQKVIKLNFSICGKKSQQKLFH